ncbi:hypothetical protein [Arthrobacter sp. HLT1-20]
MTTTEPVHHNHVTRDIKAAGQCPACDEHHIKPVSIEPEALPASGESFTLNTEIRDNETGTLDKVEIKVSGYSTAAHAVRALYKLGQEGYLAHLYQMLTGTEDEEEANDDD